MRTPGRVFLPLDLSEHSRAALALARSLGTQHTEYTIAHALPSWHPALRATLFPYMALDEDELLVNAELRDTARRLILEHLRLNESSEPDVQLLTETPEHEALVAALRRCEAELVVMGAFGEHGARPEDLGRVAAHMLRHSTRPVLLVRSFSAKPSIQRVLCAVDLSPGSASVLRGALMVALAAGAEMELLHVIPDPLADDTNQLVAAHVQVKPRQIIARSRGKLEALFERACAEVTPGLAEEARVRALLAKRRTLAGDPSSAILQHAEQSGADLIVVGTRSHERAQAAGALGRVAHRVARMSHTHTLVVPTVHDPAQDLARGEQDR